MVKVASIDNFVESCRQACLAISDNIIISANKLAADLLGYSSRELLTGLATSPIIGKQVLEPGVHSLSLPTDSDIPLEIVAFTVSWPTSEDVWLVYLHPNLACTETVASDMAPCSNYCQSRLIKEMQDMEKAYQFQKRFIRSFSHDVRTPLTAVQGYVRMLSDGVAGDITETQSQYLQKALDSSDQLLDMINRVLKTSKSEALGPKLDPVSCRPDQIVARAVSSVSPQAKDKGIRINYHSKDCAEGLYDRQRLLVVLLNLLQNAVKFTDEGSIDVYIETCSGGVEIVIVDTGIGIPETSIADIFDEFTQIQPEDKHENSGFGLGLSIVANMIELMGGWLVVSSLPGTGTGFTLRVPELNAEQQK